MAFCDQVEPAPETGTKPSAAAWGANPRPPAKVRAATAPAIPSRAQAVGRHSVDQRRRAMRDRSFQRRARLQPGRDAGQVLGRGPPDAGQLAPGDVARPPPTE